MQVQHTVSTFTAYACIYMRNLHCAGEETKRRRRKKKTHGSGFAYGRRPDERSMNGFYPQRTGRLLPLCLIPKC